LIGVHMDETAKSGSWRVIIWHSHMNRTFDNR
jgi:hypothetical protein